MNVRHPSNLRAWLALRSLPHVLRRGVRLMKRHGIRPAPVERRMADCVRALVEFGATPTVFVPGRVVERHPQAMRQLHHLGAELGVHGFDHIDHRALPPWEAALQLGRGRDSLRRLGIPVHGFRCPYLSCSDALAEALPPGAFSYSSNNPITWRSRIQPQPVEGSARANAHAFQTETRFYRAVPGEEAASLPHPRASLVELPVAVPSDLQLVDGLGMIHEELANTWLAMLEAVHQRRALFVLLFHGELADRCLPSLIALIDAARRLRPGVWIAPLHEIADWWSHTPAAPEQAGPTSGTRWPGDAACALSLTCDLDALTLGDYARRLTVGGGRE